MYRRRLSSLLGGSNSIYDSLIIKNLKALKDENNHLRNSNLSPLNNRIGSHSFNSLNDDKSDDRSEDRHYTKIEVKEGNPLDIS
jgi:hypothetical protein